jgi:nucleotide-binding universal stress UspA family protein
MPVIQNQVGLALDKIIVATDFSPESEKALSYARALAHHFASKLVLAHVVDLSIAVPTQVSFGGPSLDSMRHDSAENMERALYDLEIEGLKAQAETVEAHNPAEAIVNLAEKIDADMVIVGTHSRRGLSKLILGSCSESIVHSASCPVLTIGPNADAKPLDVAFRSIVFATGLQHNAVAKAAVALAFAKDSIAKIQICHVIEPNGRLADALEEKTKAEATLSKLIPDASYDWCTPKPSVEFGDIEEHILGMAQKVDADLIVLGAHRGTSWLHRFWDGIVERVIGRAHCPVLTICT